MIILFAAAMFSAMIFLAVRKHQQEQAQKALVLAEVQRRQQAQRQQRPY